VTVARSSSDGSAIGYVLSVLWMTSCFHVIERMEHNQRRSVCSVQFVRWRHRGETCRLRRGVAWAWLSFRYTAPVRSARLGMIGTSSSVPRHYPGTLSPADGQRSEHNVGVSLGRSRLCDLKPKTIGGDGRERECVRRHLYAGGLVAVIMKNLFHILSPQNPFVSFCC